MAKFRKRPLAVDAWRYTGGWELPDDAPDWLRAAWRRPPDPARSYPALHVGTVRAEMGFDDWFLAVGTLEGRTFASPGEWIIRGVKGELYPCRHDIFTETYEPLDTQAPAHQAQGGK